MYQKILKIILCCFVAVQPQVLLAMEEGDESRETRTYPNIVAYRDTEGHTIVDWDERRCSKSLFWGMDPETFHELNVVGFGGRPREYTLSFEVSGEKSGNITVKDDQATIKKGDRTVVFSKIIDPDEIKRIQETGKFIPLPVSTAVEYFFKVNGEEDQYVLVTRPKRKWTSYDSLRLFVGKPGAMEEKKIKKTQRWRDGGTTLIDSEEAGSILFPTPLSRSKPTWKKAGGSKVALGEVNGVFDYSSLGIPRFPSVEEELHTPLDLFS